MTSLDRKIFINKIRRLVKKYVVTYIYNYFKFNGIILPGYFLDDIEKEIKEVVNDHIRLSVYQKLKANFDLLILGKFNPKEVIGFENALKLIQKSLQITFEKIASSEPEEIILDCLKSKNKFLIIIEFCFKDYIINSLKKKFPFLEKLYQQKKELIFEKVMNKIFDNYNYYKNYNSNRSKFKTFLYKDAILSGIKVFREENMSYGQLTLSKKSYEEFIRKYEIGLINKEKMTEWESKNFFSGKELSDWLENEIDENSFNNFGKNVWPYIKSNEGYTDSNIEYINEPLEFTEDNLSYWEDKSDIIPFSNKKLFLKSLDQIEKDSAHRLVLKIVLGLDINYLNSEIIHVFNKSIDLRLIKKLHELLLLYGLEMKANFFNEVYFLLKEKSLSFVGISANSIQRRVNRNLKKIQKNYKSNEFSDLVISITRSIDKNLFEQPPVFLKLTGINDFDLLYDKKFSSRLKIIDFSNCLLYEIPKEIFEIKPLEEIDLSNNMLKNIPKDFKVLENLKLINLKDQFEKKGFHSSRTFCQISTYDIDWIKNNLQNCIVVI